KLNTRFSDTPSRDDIAENECPSAAITTAAARQVWEYVFEEPWPEDLIVLLADYLAPEDANAVQGDRIRPRRKIQLDWHGLNRDFERFGYPDAVLGTLVHEFIRLRLPGEIADTDTSPEFTEAFVAAYSRLRDEDAARWLCKLNEAWKFLVR